jgi:hypothetical protein
MPRIALPGTDEFAPYYGKYIARLIGDDVFPMLEGQAGTTAKLLAATPESLAGHRYGPGKWSVREVVGHLSDSERVFAYRALRIGRGDDTPLAGFDENLYVPGGRFERRTLADVTAEFAAVRAATLALFASFDEQALLLRGTANANPVSVRALAAILAGHEKHHVELLRERYGLVG